MDTKEPQRLLRVIGQYIRGGHFGEALKYTNRLVAELASLHQRHEEPETVRVPSPHLSAYQQAADARRRWAEQDDAKKRDEERAHQRRKVIELHEEARQALDPQIIFIEEI